jgi:hypothetical protein
MPPFAPEAGVHIRIDLNCKTLAYTYFIAFPEEPDGMHGNVFGAFRKPEKAVQSFALPVFFDKNYF